MFLVSSLEPFEGVILITHSTVDDGNNRRPNVLDFAPLEQEIQYLASFPYLSRFPISMS